MSSLSAPQIFGLVACCGVVNVGAWVIGLAVYLMVTER